LVSDIPAGDGNIEKLFYSVAHRFYALLAGFKRVFQYLKKGQARY
jgi:hypothetical protein